MLFLCYRKRNLLKGLFHLQWVFLYVWIKHNFCLTMCLLEILKYTRRHICIRNKVVKIALVKNKCHRGVLFIRILNFQSVSCFRSMFYLNLVLLCFFHNCPFRALCCSPLLFGRHSLELLRRCAFLCICVVFARTVCIIYLFGLGASVYVHWFIVSLWL